MSSDKSDLKKYEKIERPVIEETVIENASQKPSVFENRVLKAIGLKTRLDFVICMIGAVLIAGMIAVAVLLFFGVFATDEAKAASAVYYGRNEPGEIVCKINSTDEQQKELSDNMKLIYRNAKFDFFALSEYDLADTDDTMPLTLSNPSYNDCVIIFTITDGNGKVLYRSLGVESGMMVPNVKFNSPLDYGENDLKLYVTAFTTKEKNGKTEYIKLGNSIANIKINHICEDIG